MIDFGKEFATLVRFGLVGLANTGLSVGLMFLLDLTGWPVAVYTTIAYGAGIICSFLLNRWFTFREGKDRQATRMLRFVVTTLALLGFVQVIQYFCIDVLQTGKPWGIAIAMAFYTGMGFIVNRIWVFNKTRTST